jgi:soluble lytic murein transglycosylase-like protein
MNIRANLPATVKAFYEDYQVSKNATAITSIKNSFSSYVAQMSRLANIPEEIIYAFIFIESGGKVKAKSPAGAIGLMQIMANSATDFLYLEKKDNRLNDEEKKILASKLGNERLSKILSMQYMGQKVVVTEEDLYDPQLNILIGTIYLGLLIDRFTTLDGVLRLDKVAVQYNMGWFANKKGTSLTGNTESLVASLNKESANYILKLVGKNGVLTSIV